MKCTVLIGVVTMVLISVSVCIGCNSTEEADNKESLLDMMKMVPKDSWSFTYMNVDAFRTDVDLEGKYDDLVEGFESWTSPFGISFDVVDSFAVGGRNFGDMILLFEGDHNLDVIRATLTQQYSVSEYQGVEVWGEFYIALVSDKLVVLGEIRNCVDAIMNIDTSLYGDDNFRFVAERLPTGILVDLQDGALRVVNFYSAYDGIQVSGWSAIKKDEHSMKITAVCKFGNEDAAMSAMDAIEDDLEYYPYADLRNVDVKQDAEYIEVTCEMDIEEVLPVSE